MFESFQPFRKNQVPNYEYIKLVPGKSWDGFLAGPVVGVPSHFNDGTVGCRRALTKNALTCMCDGQEIETRWRGYVPLWDIEGVRWVIVMGDRYGPQAMRLKHMDQVRVTKTLGRGYPIRVEERVHCAKVPPLNKAERMPQDLRRWMARVWGDEQLEQWFIENPNPDIDLTKPIPYTKADKDLAKKVEAIESRLIFKPNSKDATLSGTLDAALNGIHKKKKT